MWELHLCTCILFKRGSSTLYSCKVIASAKMCTSLIHFSTVFEGWVLSEVLKPFCICKFLLDCPTSSWPPQRTQPSTFESVGMSPLIWADVELGLQYEILASYYLLICCRTSIAISLQCFTVGLECFPPSSWNLYSISTKKMTPESV